MDIKSLSKRETKPVIAVCRLCISFTECAQSINHLSLFLGDILPIMDLTLSNNPVVCVNCANSLTTSFKFKKMCIETEGRIREYYNKTKNAVNLIALLEDQQTCGTISNLSKNGFVNNNTSANIAGDTIKVDELDLPFIEEQQSIDWDVPENSFSLISRDKKNNHKSIFIKPEQKTLKLEERKENMETSFNKTKAEDPEIDVNKIALKECIEFVDDNHYIMSNVVEIMESDIVSDIDISEDEDFTDFKEFCCKRKYDKQSDNALDPRDSVQVIANIEEIEHTGSDSESRDSDMIFIEDCDSQNASSRVIYTGVTETKVDTEKVNASFPCKSLQPDSLLSTSINSQAVNQNKNQINSVPFSCALCPTTFSTKIQVNQHLTKHKNAADMDKNDKSQKYYCNHCSYQTVISSNFVTHMAKNHNQSDKGSKVGNVKISGKLYKKVNNDHFMCVLCPKTFTQKLHLDGHLLTKHNDVSNIEKKVTSKIHFCHYCSFRTINNYNLAKHLLSKHKKNSTQYNLKFKTFSCSHCDYSTQNKGNLITHERRHSSIKAFQCYFCEKSFHQKGNLNTHFFQSHATTLCVGKTEEKF